jgi:hypothetical protein
MTMGNSTILENMTHPARQNPGRSPAFTRTRTVVVASDPRENPRAQQNPYNQGAAIQTTMAAAAVRPAVPVTDVAAAADAIAAMTAMRPKSTAQAPNTCQPVASTTGRPFLKYFVRLRAL